MYKNLGRLINSAYIVPFKSFHSPAFFGPQVTTTDLTKSFKNVLNSPDLRELTKNLENLVVNKPEFKQISDKILDNHSDKKKYLFPSDEKHLKRKLNIKLGWIVLSLRRLTSACDNNFLSDEVKLNLIRSTLANQINNKSLEQAENEQEILQILEILGMEETDEEENKLIELEDNSHVDSFFKTYGVEKKGSEIIDYREDIVRSVELEIEEKASELRKDFPNIDPYLNELHYAVTTEWLSEYKDRYLDNKYSELDSIWENEDGDPEWICP